VEVSTTRMTPKAKTPHILLVSKPPPSRKSRNARLRRAGDQIQNVRRQMHLPPLLMCVTTLSWHLPKLRETFNRQPSANAHEYASSSDRIIADPSEIAFDGGPGVPDRKVSPVSRGSKRKPSYENVTELPPRDKRTKLQSLHRTPSLPFEEITS